MPPTTGQLVLLLVSIALFTAGGLVSLARLRGDSPPLQLAARVSMVLGLLSAVGVLAWHSMSRGAWQPMNDNFDALIWLAVLLALFVVYTQRAKPIGGLDWFVMPIVILLLISAAIFGRLDFHQYKTIGKDVWIWVHRAASYAGAVAFAIAAAGGAMYVMASQRLRRKRPHGPFLGSLEGLERLMMSSVTLGFALLTVGIITGFGKMIDSTQPAPYAKLLLTSLAWIVYAVVMHAPINPRFRGRKAALLSMFGFVLMVGTLVAVQFMPGGKV